MKTKKELELRKKRYLENEERNKIERKKESEIARKKYVEHSKASWKDIASEFNVSEGMLKACLVSSPLFDPLTDQLEYMINDLKVVIEEKPIFIKNKFGNNCCIIKNNTISIPQENLDKLDWKNGDYVGFGYDYDELGLLIMDIDGSELRDLLKKVKEV